MEIKNALWGSRALLVQARGSDFYPVPEGFGALWGTRSKTQILRISI